MGCVCKNVFTHIIDLIVIIIITVYFEKGRKLHNKAIKVFQYILVWPSCSTATHLYAKLSYSWLVQSS